MILQDAIHELRGLKTDPLLKTPTHEELMEALLLRISQELSTLNGILEDLTSQGCLDVRLRG